MMVTMVMATVVPVVDHTKPVWWVAGPGSLTRSTTDILGWLFLSCGGGVALSIRMSIISSLYPPNASSTP